MASWSRFHWPKLAGSPSRLRGQPGDELRAPACLGGSGTPQGTVEQGPHFKRPWVPAHGRAQQLPTPERCLRPNLPLRSSSISTRHSRSNGWPYTTTATSLTAGSGPVPVWKSNTVKSANGDVSINVKASPSPRGCASPRKTSVWPGLQSAQLSLEAPDTALPGFWPRAPVLPCPAPSPPDSTPSCRDDPQHGASPPSLPSPATSRVTGCSPRAGPSTSPLWGPTQFSQEPRKASSLSSPFCRHANSSSES